MKENVEAILAILFGIGIFYSFYRGNKRRKKVKRTCAYCKNQIPVDANVCPYCRHKVGYFDDFGAELRGMWAETGCLMRIFFVSFIAICVILYLFE